ncbi:MAG: hypothetical protein Q9203_001892 [Teloschistes exilis]
MSGQAGNSEASKNAPERTAHEKQHLHFKAITLYIRALQNAGVFEHDNPCSKRAEAEDEDKYAKFRQGLFDKHFDESASEPGTEGKAGYNTAENDLINAGLGITLGCDSWPSLAARNAAFYHFIDQVRNLHHHPLNLETLYPHYVVEAYNALLLGEESMTKLFQKQTPVVTTPGSASVVPTPGGGRSGQGHPFSFNFNFTVRTDRTVKGFSSENLIAANSAAITTTAERANMFSKAARSPRVTKPGFTVLGIHAVKDRKARERNKRLGRATAINGLPDNVKALLSKEQIDQLLHD